MPNLIVIFSKLFKKKRYKSNKIIKFLKKKKKKEKNKNKTKNKRKKKNNNKTITKKNKKKKNSIIVLFSKNWMQILNKIGMLNLFSLAKEDLELFTRFMIHKIKYFLLKKHFQKKKLKIIYTKNKLCWSWKNSLQFLLFLSN